MSWWIIALAIPVAVLIIIAVDWYVNVYTPRKHMKEAIWELEASEMFRSPLDEESH